MRKLFLLSAVVALLLPTLSLATFVSLTPPDNSLKGINGSPAIVGTTWDVYINIPSDCVRVDWISGDQFLAPTVFHDFDDVGWSQTWGLAVGAVAEGPNVASTHWLFDMDGMTQDTTIRWAIYLDGSYAGASQWDYYVNSGEWDTYNIQDWDPGKDQPGVPEPASLLLLGGGLAIAGARRRFRKN